MEVRADDPAAAVAYLEQPYDDWEIEVSERCGSEDSWLPGLHRVSVSDDLYARGEVTFQPMFTIKEDYHADDLYECSLCLRRARHRCWLCGRFSTHMADDECFNCWERELRNIARRPPEEDPR